MPTTFTDAMVRARAESHGVSAETPEELREALARLVETKYGDWVEAREIRTGRPWDEFTKDDIEDIEARAPGCTFRNLGMLRRRLALGMETAL